ncbi:MAG TPA: hypothetical protein PK858_09220, partial [Saprospiraceae bacterium]|nr:hypothetical protein [Saprospiraceae bacterium]
GGRRQRAGAAAGGDAALSRRSMKVKLHTYIGRPGRAISAGPPLRWAGLHNHHVPSDQSAGVRAGQESLAFYVIP